MIVAGMWNTIMSEKIRLRTLHKGQLIDAIHLLQAFTKQEYSGTPHPVEVVLQSLEEAVRESKVEGCDWSHDLMIRDLKLTFEDHIEGCGCDCPFCESEHDRVGANTRDK